jgi:stage III sporulation protein AB
MLKLLLCLLIFISCSLLGYLKALGYTQREMELKEFLQALISLESEMQYRRDPILVCLKRVSQSKQNSATSLFSILYDKLFCSNENDFYKAWCTSIDKVYKHQNLISSDIMIIKDIGLDLGKSDIQSQGRFFARQYQLLEVQIAQAQEDCKTKGKMYRSLGISIGIIIIIIFI